MLYSILGPSGSGKTSLSESIFGKENKIITYTTRLPRPKEQNGKDYHFITEEKFRNLIEKDFFFEYTNYNGYYYGTSNESLLEAKNKDLYIVQDIYGYYKTKEYLNEDNKSILIYAEKSVLISILRNRKLSKEITLSRIKELDSDFKIMNENKNNYDIIFKNNFSSIKSESKRLNIEINKLN